MNRIWAVAQHAIAEGIRMKLALVFLALIGVVVVGLPFSIQGDGSLTGAVQAFMSYAFAATSFLLGILTIFLSRSLSDEIMGQQICLLVTKPVPRWQIVAGKWLGITVMNVAFLTCVGLTVFGMVHYIMRTHPPLDPVYDRQELREHVLVARHAITPKPENFRRSAEMEYERRLEEGFYDDRPDLNREDELERLARKHEAAWRSVPPLNARMFEFENVLVDRTRTQRLQFRYYTQVVNYPPDEVFRSRWRFGNPAKGTPEYEIRTRHRVDRYQTIPFPADAVADDHTLTVRFYNQNPYYPAEPQASNFIQFRKSKEVEVLFVVGSFAGNMLRLLTMMLCKLMFLAALSLCMTTLFSFPVAALVSFTVYVLAGTRMFMEESLDLSRDSDVSMFDSAKELLVQCLLYAYDVMFWVIPDFGRYDAVEDFVNGRNISLVWVLQALCEVGMLKAFTILGLAMLFFHRREVAEVSL